jgi:hypothetical protein
LSLIFCEFKGGENWKTAINLLAVDLLGWKMVEAIKVVGAIGVEVLMLIEEFIELFRGWKLQKVHEKQTKNHKKLENKGKQVEMTFEKWKNLEKLSKKPRNITAVNHANLHDATRSSNFR